MDRWTPLYLHLPVIHRQMGRRRRDKTGSGHLSKPGKVNMDILCRPHAFDKPGKHAGIGGLHVGTDQRRAKPGYRLHRKRFEKRHLGVPATDEDEFTGCGGKSLHQAG